MIQGLCASKQHKLRIMNCALCMIFIPQIEIYQHVLP